MLKCSASVLTLCSALLCSQLVSEAEIPEPPLFTSTHRWEGSPPAALHSDKHQIPSLISICQHRSFILIDSDSRRTICCYCCRHFGAERQPDKARPVTDRASPGGRRLPPRASRVSARRRCPAIQPEMLYMKCSTCLVHRALYWLKATSSHGFIFPLKCVNELGQCYQDKSVSVMGVV